MIKYYYEEKNKQTLITKIKNAFEENGKNYIELEDSIFYPQGGGQKGDIGYILIDNKKYNIINTIKNEKQESLIITDELPENAINKEVKCFLDWTHRYKQMRLHTSLHLIHSLIEDEIKRPLEYPLTSSIEDGWAYNKYNEDAFDIKILEKVNEKFLRL